MKKNTGINVYTPKRSLAKNIGLAGLGALILLVTVLGYGKEFFPHLRAVENENLPSAHFPHDAHMDFLDCLDCHHQYENGENTLNEADLYEGNPDIQCGSCHNGKKSFPLLRAFHRQCIQCHEQEDSGPVNCGECHEKS